ncbi:unnamed protein product [Adineta ricciae]|uniref:Uncharacterized protein n=1 Tax=Adineta ricciae TaxID=249248 RepID=A0A814VB83_ADIRI|nr:unnamed protein product [Adineta ricciae]CAF1186640.1 unnamed protein product [Adineta ricciae]
MSNSTISKIATVLPVNTENLLMSTPKLRRNNTSIIKEFSFNTSMHGIPGIARSESLLNRAFWSVSFLIFTGIMLYFVVQSIITYFNYPTQTSVSFSDEWPQNFPAVTICNNSPFMYDSFIGPFLNYTNSLNLTHTNDTTVLSSQQARYIRDFLIYKLNRNESVTDFFYPLESILIKCIFNGISCSVNDFIQFVSPVYGSCYTFNAKVDHINNGTIHQCGDYGGVGLLELGLYTHNHQYVPFVNDDVGIVALVHDNTKLPAIDIIGSKLAPGRKYRLNYRKRTNTLLPTPYTTCTDETTERLQIIFDQYVGVKYDYVQELCFRVTLQTYTYEQCGCISPLQWAFRYILVPGTNRIVQAPLCNISDPCYTEAAIRTQGPNPPSPTFDLNCGLECTTNEFVVRLSSSLAPTSWYMDEVKSFVESSSIRLSKNWSTNWAAEIGRNYVGIEVVTESTKVEVYTQQASLSRVDVLSNIGGQTGLWIGISFLSLMEIAEMVFRLIRYQSHSICRKLFK